MYKYIMYNTCCKLVDSQQLKAFVVQLHICYNMYGISAVKAKDSVVVLYTLFPSSLIFFCRNISGVR